MDNLTLKQQIHLWKAIPDSLRNGETDSFIDDLVCYIEELENQIEDLDNQLLEMSEYD